MGTKLYDCLGVAVSELVDDPDCDSGFCGFKSHRSPLSSYNATIAQLVEHRSEESGVVGSIPTRGTKYRR